MARILAQYILPFLLPFLGYFAYRLLVDRGRGYLSDTPWFMLTTIGLSLTVVSLIGLALTDAGGPADGVYIPPHMEDGRIVPGRIE
ncbi:MAG: hypothetical protein KDE35_16275 [Geminicoccaceae bacterium]|nr:hypothetical protein [Geminicoccaceae bacterium]